MKITISLFGILLLSALAACAPKGSLMEKPATAETKLPEVQAAEKASWEREWEETLTQAKKEGKVSVYVDQGPEIRIGLQEAFKQKYGIIDVEFTPGRGTELQQKILSEHRAGLNLWDIALMGRSQHLAFKAGNMLQPLAPLLLLPEVKEEHSWFEGRIPYLDKEGYIISYAASAAGQLAINTEMVRKNEIRFIRDLLNPRWKGEILMEDPTVGGPASLHLAIWMILHGEEFGRALVKQQPILTREPRQLAEWVARGKYPVLIGPREPFRQMMSAGLPVAYQEMEDGTYLASSVYNISISNRAPHPFAARIFLNWLLSKEGQTVSTKVSQMHSARVDVDISLVDPSKRRKPAIKYYNAITEEFEIDIVPKYRRLIEEIFAPLTR